ncbi:PKD domain-containing protein [bacterium]|nr:PKD domain-containing protein [bacterium]
MNSKKFFKILFFSGIVLFSFCFYHQSFAEEKDVFGFAWSENIGWISFNSASDGSPIDYGVKIDTSTGNLSGYAWSENIDWISFNRSDTGSPPLDDQCPSGTCIAKVDDPGNLKITNVKIKGWARALAACDSVPCTSSGPCSNCGGWDGWIRFDHGQVNEVYIDPSGDFYGWAWADEVIGWISFNSRNCDSDGDGFSDGTLAGCPPAGTPIPAYKVSIEISNSPPIADADGSYTVLENNTILLDGTGSKDNDGSIVSYVWSGQCASYLDDVNIPQPTFTAPEISSDEDHKDYTCTLTVTDNDGATGSDNTKVTVINTVSPPSCSVSLSSDLSKDWIWQTKPMTLTWSGTDIVQCRRWIEIWNPFDENIILKDTSAGDIIPYDNWTSDWNGQTSGTITTYPGSGPSDPITGKQPRNWIGKLWRYKIRCKDSSGLCVREKMVEVNVKPRPIWREVAP